MPSSKLPSPDSNAERPVPPVESRPAWVVPCPDLDAATQRFESNGFSLLAIGPADDPRWALMSSGHRTYAPAFRLDTAAYVDGHRHPFLEVDRNDPLLQSSTGVAVPEFVAAGPDPRASGPAHLQPPGPTKLGAATPIEWVVGRAGMRYRDLLPGRWGGQFIASHIHIPDGGPVPDYVHYHHVDFQLIFCHQGWVRVVYQDQGEPFVLEPGDAILQAPGIRHRVLEASDDLHVVEVSSPAEHVTFVEHGLELPNRAEPGRWYGGQRFVHHRAADTPWVAAGPGVQVQTLELEPATSGRYGAFVIQLEVVDGAELELPAAGSVDFEFVAVLDGSLVVADTSGGEEALFGAGSALNLDDGVAWAARPRETSRILVVSRHRT